MADQPPERARLSRSFYHTGGGSDPLHHPLSERIQLLGSVGQGFSVKMDAVPTAPAADTSAQTKARRQIPAGHIGQTTATSLSPLGRLGGSPRFPLPRRSAASVAPLDVAAGAYLH